MTRDLRLDLVRVIAIFGVVTLHVGAGVTSCSLNLGNQLAVDFLLAMARCSVNIFGLLSGYLKVGRAQHHASIIRILAETFFWCFITAVICAVLFGQRSVYDFLLNAFPLLSDRLWYISCYFFVFMCSPFLNLLVNRLSHSAYKRLLIIVGVLMSMIPTILMLDPFHAAGSGYSAGWLMYLYLLGGYFKLYGFSGFFTKKKSIVALFISIGIMVLSKYGITVLRNILHPILGIGPLIKPSILFDPYNSPLVLLNSVLILFLCVNMKEIKYNWIGKTIKWLSSVSLGVYIIHSQPFVLDHVLTAEKMFWAVRSNPLLTALILLGVTLAVLLLTGFMEQLRMWLFKMCRIDRGIGKLGVHIDKRFSSNKSQKEIKT